VSPRRLSRITLGATLVLIAVGGYTRGSGSGFGCADRWPLCEGGLLGGWLPRLEYHMVVEWSHRWVAAVVGVLAVLTLVAAWRRATRGVTVVAAAAVAVIGVQAWVGRLVVAHELDTDLVTLHLFLSMTIVALLAVVAAATTPRAGEPDGGWALGIGGAAAVAFGLILAGAFVHDLYVSGWPLVGGRPIPPLGDPLIAVHFLHRLLALLVLVFAVVLAVAARRRGRPAGERRLLDLVLAAHVANIGVGAAHVFTRVGSSLLVALHLLLAAVVWVGLVTATARAAGVGAATPDRVAAAARAPVG
jgi:heme A synthase